MRKNSYITGTDLFCGAGGSSQGAQEAGIEVKLAMNHWQLAVKTHATNFPHTDHDCADIRSSDPRRYNSTDFLIGSPECTKHSLARGKPKPKKQLNIFESQKEQDERSRATMWDIPRFAEVHHYNIIVTENVVDAKRWEQYPAWIYAMELLGYSYHECYFNSMHFNPTPQSRDRLFVVFWKKGNKAPDLNYMPKAFCSKCEKEIYAVQTWKPNCTKDQRGKPYGKYRAQYDYRCSCGTVVEPYYYAAFNCIDFSIKSERIGDKKRKLKPNTLKRIEVGIEKFWNNPFVMYGGDRGPNGKIDRTYGLDRPLPTQCGSPWHSLISPFLTYSSNNHGDPSRVSDSKDAMNTQTTTQDVRMTMPPVPFIVRNTNPGHWSEMKKPIGTQIASTQHCIISPSPGFITRSGYGGEVMGLDETMKAQTTHQNFDFVQPPFITELYGTSDVKSMDKPIGAQLATKHDMIITSEAWQSFIGYYYGNAYESHITDAIGTCTSKDRHYKIDMPAGKKIAVEDCYYRMIRAKEVGKAMAFADDYIVLGDEREKVKQYGNAVTPPVMKWIIQQCVNSLK